jgi:hypothetical protein
VFGLADGTRVEVLSLILSSYVFYFAAHNNSYLPYYLLTNTYDPNAWSQLHVGGDAGLA